MNDGMELMMSAYETLSELANMSEGISNQTYTEEACIWKLLAILDCRLCHISAMPIMQVMRSLEQSKSGEVVESYYALLGMLDDDRLQCMGAMGFTCENYELWEELDVPLFVDNLTKHVIDAISSGYVFGENTRYFDHFMDFVANAGALDDLHSVSIRFYKNAWLGAVIERAERQNLTSHIYYVNMNRALAHAFTEIEYVIGQTDCGVMNGVFYAYVTMYEDVCGEVMDWRNMQPKFVLYVYEAVQYARMLEREIFSREHVV